MNRSKLKRLIALKIGVGLACAVAARVAVAQGLPEFFPPQVPRAPSAEQPVARPAAAAPVAAPAADPPASAPAAKLVPVDVTAPAPPAAPAAPAKIAKPKVARSVLTGTARGCGTVGALGVSRIQEIDTSTGARLGHQQYKDTTFLGDHEVVLTFDDGPLRPYTMPVLRALEAHCTKATFFVVGRMALSDPSLVRETAKRGHTIGTHTWSHVDVRKTGPSRGKGEIELGISAVAKALGHPPAPFFRFPYLSAPANVVDYANARKLAVFSIEVDSNDYRTKDPETVHKAVLSQLEENHRGIILFHDIQASTAGALKGLLDELKARGYKVVHVVPKGGVTATTLPEYDAIAERELHRKSVASADDPLANRSIVWPVSAGRDPDPRGVAANKKATAALGRTPEDEMLPWGVVAVKPEAIVPRPAAKRRTEPTDDNDWLTRLFKF